MPIEDLFGSCSYAEREGEDGCSGRVFSEIRGQITSSWLRRPKSNNVHRGENVLSHFVENV